MEILFQGAESKIYIEQYLGRKMLVKERFVKGYRHPNLDTYLTRERIKAECRNIMRCKQAGIKTPAIYFMDLDKRIIYMEYFEHSKTVKSIIDEFEKKPEENKTSLETLFAGIGRSLALMHSKGIVHGDLTTSNILWANDEIVFIDFGLSSSNAATEEKAVDLYVLERALLSTHANAENIFRSILEVYERYYDGKQCPEVLAKFLEVKARGRKRTMVG